MGDQIASLKGPADVQFEDHLDRFILKDDPLAVWALRKQLDMSLL